MNGLDDQLLQDIAALSDSSEEDWGAPESQPAAEEPADAEMEEFIKRSNLISNKSVLRTEDAFLQHLAVLRAEIDGEESKTEEESPHELILKTNEYLPKIDYEIVNIVRHIREKYLARFAELE